MKSTSLPPIGLACEVDAGGHINYLTAEFITPSSPLHLVHDILNALSGQVRPSV
jgi:hypothetical protein